MTNNYLPTPDQLYGNWQNPGVIVPPEGPPIPSRPIPQGPFIPVDQTTAPRAPGAPIRGGFQWMNYINNPGQLQGRTPMPPLQPLPNINPPPLTNRPQLPVPAAPKGTAPRAKAKPPVPSAPPGTAPQPLSPEGMAMRNWQNPNAGQVPPPGQPIPDPAGRVTPNQGRTDFQRMLYRINNPSQPGPNNRPAPTKPPVPPAPPGTAPQAKVLPPPTEFESLYAKAQQGGLSPAETNRMMELMRSREAGFKPTQLPPEMVGPPRPPANPGKPAPMMQIPRIPVNPMKVTPGMVGKLGTAGAVAGAAYGGYQLGSDAYDVYQGEMTPEEAYARSVELNNPVLSGARGAVAYGQQQGQQLRQQFDDATQGSNPIVRMANLAGNTVNAYQALNQATGGQVGEAIGRYLPQPQNLRNGAPAQPQGSSPAASDQRVAANAAKGREPYPKQTQASQAEPAIPQPNTDMDTGAGQRQAMLYPNKPQEIANMMVQQGEGQQLDNLQYVLNGGPAPELPPIIRGESTPLPNQVSQNGDWTRVTPQSETTYTVPGKGTATFTGAQPKGGGTLSVVSTPGVEGYERQFQAMRDLRNAQREYQGLPTVEQAQQYAAMQRMMPQPPDMSGFQEQQAALMQQLQDASNIRGFGKRSQREAAMRAAQTGLEQLNQQAQMAQQQYGQRAQFANQYLSNQQDQAQAQAKAAAENQRYQATYGQKERELLDNQNYRQAQLQQTGNKGAQLQVSDWYNNFFKAYTASQENAMNDAPFDAGSFIDASPIVPWTVNGQTMMVPKERLMSARIQQYVASGLSPQEAAMKAREEIIRKVSGM